MKHISDPDHTINRRLHKLYPPEIAERAVNDIIDLIFKYKQRITSKEYHLSEKDIILITYGDQVTGEGGKPLAESLANVPAGRFPAYITFSEEPTGTPESMLQAIGAQILDHALHHPQLLEVFLSEDRDVGSAQIEQPGDHGDDAVEMARPRCPLERSG